MTQSVPGLAWLHFPFQLYFLESFESMALSTYSAVLFAIACFLTSGSASAPLSGTSNAPERGNLEPKWRVDLTSIVGSASLGKVFGRTREYQGLPQASLWFTSNETLVATFVTREGQPELASRDGLEASLPLRLRPVFLNANTGKVLTTLDLPTDSRNAGVIAVHDGRFVTQRGNELTLYTPDLKPLKQLKLPLVESGWIAYPSPSGKNVLLLPSGHKAGSWLWLDTDSLQILHSWEDNQNGDVAMADDKIAMITCTWSHNCDPRLEIRTANEVWKPISPGSRQSHPQFVSDDMLFLSGHPAKLIRADGGVVFVEDRFSGCGSGAVFPSANALRFVVPSCKLKGNASASDMGGYQLLQRIYIYDAPFQELAFVLDVGGAKSKGLMRFAVSPDGSKLAILNDESIEVLQLPAPR